MRVPVLKSDLTSSYNKVAKYIGRHWPAEKLGLGKSRESLAVLFGYNSLHEVNKSVDSTSLPEYIELSKVYKSMVGKALYHFGIRPDVLMPVLQRAPLKEMAFYKVTDMEKQRIADEAFQADAGFLMIRDEMGMHDSYKSPQLIIDQHKQSLLPPYSYAVSQDGFIFSASTYESLINQLGSADEIKELVAEIGGELSVDDFISQYVSPNAWLPLDQYLTLCVTGYTNRWPTPFMVDVFYIGQRGKHLGHVVKHNGYDAFYPVLCESVEDVLSLLKKIYMNEPIHATSLPAGEVEVRWSLTPYTEQVSQWEDFHKTSFDLGALVIDGQHFIRDVTHNSYPELQTNSVLKAFEWEEAASASDAYSQHASIRKSLYPIIKLVDFCADLTSEKCSTLFAMCFHNERYGLEELFATEEGDWTYVDEADKQKWLDVGLQVAAHHPELVAYFDVGALGYLFCNYEQSVRGNRYAWCCEERDIALVGYTLSKSSLFTCSKIDSSDNVIAALFVLHYYAQNPSEVSLVSLQSNFNQIILMLNRYHQQKNSLEKMEKWEAHQSSIDKKYLSHGGPAEYTEQSLIEIIQELREMTRSKVVQVTTEVQDLNSFNT